MRELPAILVLLGLPVAAAGADWERGALRNEQIERAVAVAQKYLTAQIGEDGRCAGEFPKDNPRFGGKTALCAYALLTAGADHRQPALGRALNWLGGARLEGTYAVAMRACAYAAVRDPLYTALLAKDVRWLIEASASDGSYTYTAQGGREPNAYDNSNSQMAVLGVWAGAGRGVQVPLAYWQRIEGHWLSQQQIDGGWGYFTPRGHLTAKTYGSMTAAALATLYVCLDNLRQEDFIRCRPSPKYKPIADALKWLGTHFTAAGNPKLDTNHYYYWLYCLERVGLASGRKYIGGHDWFDECLTELLRRQDPRGSWGQGEGDRVPQTAFALLFLARGRQPMLINKLEYRGRWNARPRDMANLAQWVTRSLERPVNWQVVQIDSKLADWHEAPILYISGAGPCEFSDKEIAKLRTFALQGGLILSEAAGNNADFTLDMTKVYKRMFGEFQFGRLPDDHPIYTLSRRPKEMTGLAAVSNGVRLLAIHSPRQLSLAMQLGFGRGRSDPFDLMGNFYMFVTDRTSLRPRGTSGWPTPTEFEPIAAIRVARLKHTGQREAEPLAWARLAILAGNRFGIKLVVSEPIAATDLEVKAWPIAVMTGTEAFTLSQAEAAALAKYFAAGGTLITDAGGGSRGFAEAVRTRILPLVVDGVRGPIASDHPIYRGPTRLSGTLYRSAYAAGLGAARREGQFRAVVSAGRIVVLYSDVDLTSALVGYQRHGLRGYRPSAAVALMTNVLCHAAKVSLK